MDTHKKWLKHGNEEKWIPDKPQTNGKTCLLVYHWGLILKVLLRLLSIPQGSTDDRGAHKVLVRETSEAFVRAGNRTAI